MCCEIKVLLKFKILVIFLPSLVVGKVPTVIGLNVHGRSQFTGPSMGQFMQFKSLELPQIILLANQCSFKSPAK